MAIDNPRQAFEQQYMREDEKSPLGLTVFAAKLAFPTAALPLEIFRKVAERFTRVSFEQRLTETWHVLVKEIEHLEETKVSLEDVEDAIQVALRRDAEEFNDKKRERYVKLIGNTLRSETQIEDVATFVRTIEQLNERDIAVLKVLNLVMNKEGDWRAQPNPGGDIMKVHPNTFTQRAQELAAQVAMAMGQATKRLRKTFSVVRRDIWFAGASKDSASLMRCSLVPANCRSRITPSNCQRWE